MIHPLPMALVLVALTGGAAMAQANNIFINQLGGNNSALIQQIDITGSDVGSSVTPVEQTGSNNDLNIAISADNADVDSAVQNNLLDGLLRGNTASIIISDLSPGAAVELVQTGGGGNVANITVDGGAFGAVEQTGSLNQADLTVSGAGASGRIIQETSSNVAALTVEGAGLDVTFRQSGMDGLQSVNHDPTGDGGTIQGGITVFSVGAPTPITIHQTTN